MKKILLIALAALTVGSVQAQDRFIRGDASIGGAFTTGKLRSYGISAGAEPKFFFNENISVGLRLEGDVLFGGKILTESSEDISVGMSTRVAYLLKGEYYLGDGNTKPFFGLMTGWYTQANSGAGGNGSATIGVSRDWGVSPELGVTFGNFRISGLYHHVFGEKNIATLSTGAVEEISKSYFVITLGFKTFQLDL